MRRFKELTFLLVLSANIFCNAEDAINTTRFIRDGETLVSSGGSFQLGFFSPGNSENRYVGIWYRNINTVVWVANRDNPITNTSVGVTLRVTEEGILVLVNGKSNDEIIWYSSNTTSSSTVAARNPVAQLLDNGNLVVREADDINPDNYIWQSFDYPTDTFLPGMKFGRNFDTGRDVYLTSWRSNDDPGRGDYTFAMDTSGYPQPIIRMGATIQYRAGPWNGIRFSGASAMGKNSIYTFGFVFNKKEAYYHFELINSSVISRSTLNPNGIWQRWTWLDRIQGWSSYANLPLDVCDAYSKCGPYGICNLGDSNHGDSIICGCLKKFTPRYPQQWGAGDWFDGCVRRTPLNCSSDGFLKYSGIKLPDTRNSWFDESMRLDECRVRCRNDCSCMAYSNLNISGGGSGCLLWYGDLVDIKDLYPDGQDIYIRMASSELDSKGKDERILIVCLTLVGSFLLGLSIVLWIRKRKFICFSLSLMEKGGNKKNHNKDSELPLFDLSEISKATNKFSDINKLGEGGFGPVYKGTLEDGRQIAVKRLSKTSMQGINEFKNEVVFIAKLQHRNLVRILGCCIQGEEKMLVYEYMPNGSLNLILFDQIKKKLLDWPKRIQIIDGIARGLMYLHQDSQLRIIHRDIKASNILLDSDLTPKISDFGMARCFGLNETEAKTHRVVGTYGYMSPEYVMNGRFSLKSDVFSFGVILLEILSGKKNSGISDNEHNLNLLGYAWRLYKEGKSEELLDSSLGDSFNVSEALRLVHAGLLCVQRYPEDRPSMSSVVVMLRNEIALPEAKHPGFFLDGDDFCDRELIETGNAVKSVNDVTITLPDAR